MHLASFPAGMSTRHAPFGRIYCRHALGNFAMHNFCRVIASGAAMQSFENVGLSGLGHLVTLILKEPKINTQRISGSRNCVSLFSIPKYPRMARGGWPDWPHLQDPGIFFHKLPPLWVLCPRMNLSHCPAAMQARQCGMSRACLSR